MSKINDLTAEEQAEYLKNTYGIQNIRLIEQIQHKCPLGAQTGVTTYTIEVEPGETLAELVQLHWDIQKMIGTTFTLESGLAELMKTLKTHYNDAKRITITASCPSNRHMACEATISYCKKED